MRLGQGAAEDREVLGKNIDDTAIYGAPTGDDAIARDMRLVHAEVRAAVLLEHVELLEGPFVQQDVDPLARRQLAAPVLGVDAALPASQPRCLAPVLQFGQDILHHPPLQKKKHLPQGLPRQSQRREVSTKKDLCRQHREHCTTSRHMSVKIVLLQPARICHACLNEQQ
jgi:hypothetical protein